MSWVSSPPHVISGKFPLGLICITQGSREMAFKVCLWKCRTKNPALLPQKAKQQGGTPEAPGINTVGAPASCHTKAGPTPAAPVINWRAGPREQEGGAGKGGGEGEAQRGQSVQSHLS